MELKQKPTRRADRQTSVLIVPFMELKQAEVDVVELRLQVLIVPFMELKQTQGRQPTHPARS